MIDPEVKAEVLAQVAKGTPALVVEALCAQVQIMREAKARIDDEGAIVLDARGNAGEHPALKIEREAARQVTEWLDKYAERTPPLAQALRLPWWARHDTNRQTRHHRPETSRRNRDRQVRNRPTRA